MNELKMLTAAEMAARLNVSTDTVRRMCHAGKWPHSKIGRLFRFTEGHYQAIIATPQPPEPWTKERRDNIARMLRQLSK
ncbi:excisionase family DNA-binding protein [Arthrobacter sp. IA7]|uniref:helix-turn-helix domain-containing protein n=1 Tax=Arthrobacter ipis TaxID=2716202 RepID=UPI0016842A05|nr:helix-turn-helix domain-containing protein [Arthrobacter ipis]MBD1540997.1 excisionase family DNA-binding protein [Arthrobacter ipis]